MIPRTPAFCAGLRLPITPTDAGAFTFVDAAAAFSDPTAETGDDLSFGGGGGLGTLSFGNWANVLPFLICSTCTYKLINWANVYQCDLAQILLVLWFNLGKDSRK